MISDNTTQKNQPINVVHAPNVNVQPKFNIDNKQKMNPPTQFGEGTNQSKNALLG